MISSVAEDTENGHCLTLLTESHINTVLMVVNLQVSFKSLTARTS